MTRELFHSLTEAPFTAEIIDGVREAKKTGEKIKTKRYGKEVEEAKADYLKRQLPAMMFQATFRESLSKSGHKGTWRKQAEAVLNGLCVLDIDHIENPKGIFGSWLRVHGSGFMSEQGILLVYVTPSGEGLKVVFKADVAKGNLADNQHYMARELGVEIDESCKDASRMSFIPKAADILFINEDELFTYNNEEFEKRFGEEYRSGNSQPTVAGEASPGPSEGGETASPNPSEGGECLRTPDASLSSDGGSDSPPSEGSGEASGEALYHGVSYQTIIDRWLGGKQPEVTDRHRTALLLTKHLRYITNNDPHLVMRLLKAQPFVQDIIKERGEDEIDRIVSDTFSYKLQPDMPMRMVRAASPDPSEGGEGLAQSGVRRSSPPSEGSGEAIGEALDSWGAEIAALMPSYPCMRECCQGLAQEAYPAAMFVGAGLMDTLMTRTWYHFYHRPEEERRLNCSIIIIGDPSSGKSFGTRLYKLLAEPIIAQDKLATDAINRFKEESVERETSTKEQKKDALKAPEVFMRCFPSRSANGEMIKNMIRAVEKVQGRDMHLHMLTFDSELDNQTNMQKNGSWIDKQVMELKAFHNEEDGQVYQNKQSVTGMFNVYWNFIYTGTKLSLRKKVNERNFGTGLAMRLAVIPMPASHYKMMELRRVTTEDRKADETLKTWAYRLDEVKGEIDAWKIVEHVWAWCNQRMQIAAYNDDRGDELLLKRVPYYGIAISLPWILMRHWREDRKFDLTLKDLDETDLRLVSLVLDIQYRCQKHFFGGYARNYIDDQMKEQEANRYLTDRYNQNYQKLGEEFSVELVSETFEIAKQSAQNMICAWAKAGAIERVQKGQYKKIAKSI